MQYGMYDKDMQNSGRQLSPDVHMGMPLWQYVNHVSDLASRLYYILYQRSRQMCGTTFTSDWYVNGQYRQYGKQYVHHNQHNITKI